jgi:hypothetical protein
VLDVVLNRGLVYGVGLIGGAMNGIYTLWSAPRPPKRPDLSPLELLLLTTSVLQWRRWNGRAFLYCDEVYARYLGELGLLTLWDAVDTQTITVASQLGANPRVFFPLGRTVAIRVTPVPFVALDCDFIAWRPLAGELLPGEIAFTHWESTQPGYWYPPPQLLCRPPGYEIDATRNWALPAANFSLTYWGNEAVRDAYTDEVVRFASGNPREPQPQNGATPELLFAEQRLLPVIAYEHGVRMRTLVEGVSAGGPTVGDWDPLAVADQPAGLTHGWWYKKWMAVDDPRRIRLTRELIHALAADFPGAAEHLTRLGVITEQLSRG